jgi:Tol biopolymer transport system component
MVTERRQFPDHRLWRWTIAVTTRRAVLLPATVMLFLAGCFSDPVSGPDIVLKRGVLRKLTTGEGYYTSPDWSEDGQEVLYVDNIGGSRNTRIYSIPSTGGQPEELYRERNAGVSISQATWIPGSQDRSFAFLAIDQVESTFQIYSAQGGQDANSIYETDEPIFSMDVTSDGKSVLFYSSSQYQPGIIRIDLETMSTRRLETDSSWTLTGSLSCDRVGDTISYTRWERRQVIYNLFRMPVDGGPTIRVTDFKMGQYSVYDAELSPDGEEYLILTGQSAVKGNVLESYYGFDLIPASGGDPVSLVDFPHAYNRENMGLRAPQDPTWSPDGGSIAFSFGKEDNTARNIYIIDL